MNTEELSSIDATTTTVHGAEAKYLFCEIKPRDYYRTYYYISEIKDLGPEDIVIVPFGTDDKEVIGTVCSVRYYDESNAPFPINRTKKILRRISPEELQQLEQLENKEYIYCSVMPEGKSQDLYYISEIEGLKKDDMVIIPFGRQAEAYGKVTSIRKVQGKNAPFPPDRTKHIIRKADSEKKYEFLCVLPITHKQKIFSYINTLPDVKVGDYVEIDFRGELRPARVKCIIINVCET